MKISITTTEFDFTAEELRASNSLADNISNAFRAIFGRIADGMSVEDLKEEDDDDGRT